MNARTSTRRLVDLARLASGLLIVVSLTTPSVAADKNKARQSEPETFATVGQTVIAANEYETAFSMAVRRKYYHGQVPDAEMEALKVEVADQLIDRTLALAEAKRRGIQADRETIKRTIAGYEERYKQSEQWKKNRKQMIATVTKQLEEQAQLERLEASVRSVPEPTEAQARAFYESHLDLFVEPEKIHLSVILLRVDPSSPKVAWEKAAEEAASIVSRLKNGAQFEELARVHSSDASAERGGDLGYLHRGVLPEGTQALIDSLDPGAISDPVRLLEGMAVIRVVDRKAAKQHDFAEVRARAGDLWQREQGETQWKRLMAQLRAGSVIRINTSRYPALEQVAAHDRRPDTR